MKNSALYLLVVILTGILYSCKKLDSDSCENKICDNGSYCNQGNCVCPLGYEGSDCSVLSKTKFIDEWAGFDTCYASVTGLDTGQYLFNQYQIAISDSLGIHDAILVQINSGQTGYTIYGKTHQREITVPTQQKTVDINGLPLPVEGTVSGFGSLNAAENEIRLETNIVGNIFIDGFGYLPATCNCKGVITRIE